MEYPLDNKIKELFYKGFTEGMIAKKLGIPTTVVYATCNRLGFYDEF